MQALLTACLSVTGASQRQQGLKEKEYLVVRGSCGCCPGCLIHLLALQQPKPCSNYSFAECTTQAGRSKQASKQASWTAGKQAGQQASKQQASRQQASRLCVYWCCRRASLTCLSEADSQLRGAESLRCPSPEPLPAVSVSIHAQHYSLQLLLQTSLL